MESLTRPFNLSQNQRSWMTLNGRAARYCTNDASFWAHCGELKEDKPTLSAEKCSPETLLLDNISFTGASKRKGNDERCVIEIVAGSKNLESEIVPPTFKTVVPRPASMSRSEQRNKQKWRKCQGNSDSSFICRYWPRWNITLSISWRSENRWINIIIIIIIEFV